MSNFMFGDVYLHTHLLKHTDAPRTTAIPCLSTMLIDFRKITDGWKLVRLRKICKRRFGDLPETYWEEIRSARRTTCHSTLRFQKSHVRWLETELYLKIQLVHAASTPTRSVVTINDANRLALVWGMRANLRYVQNVETLTIKSGVT